MKPLYLWLLFIALCDAARILVYSPTISPSHMKINSAVADTLANTGHNVTIIDVHYMVDPRTVSFVKLAQRRIFPLPETYAKAASHKVDMAYVMNYAFKVPSYFEQWTFTRNYQRLFSKICRAHLESNKILDYLGSNQFDFVINDHVDLCGSAIAHAAGIKTHVLLSSSPLFEHTALTIGLPEESGSIPAYRHYTYKSSGNNLWNKVQNSFDWAMSYWGLRYASQLVNEIFQSKFGPQFPDIDQLVSKSALFLVNSDEFVDFPRLSRHNIVYIGGLGLSRVPDKNIKEHSRLFELIDITPKDVIYFSLGSITSTKHLPPAFMRNLLRSFQQFREFQFIVKVDENDLEVHNLLDRNSSVNVHFVSWAPQREILAHPKTRLFITHAGYGSVLEAAYAGIPLICLPFFMDQYQNAQLVQKNGWGQVFEKQELIYESNSFENVIRNTLSNKMLLKNARHLSKILHNKPQSAEQRLTQAIDLLELADFNLQELQPRNVGFLERQNFDLVMIFSCLLLVAVQLLLFLLYRFVYFVWQRQNIAVCEARYKKIE